MNLITAAVAFLLALFLVLVGVTRVGAWLIERRHPPVGSFVTVNGTRIHYVHVPAGPAADLPPLVFVHGASGNLNDQMLPLRKLFAGRAEMLFFDRPGHGWSDRGPRNENPSDQAETLAALMEDQGIRDAIIIGHSFGGAVTATFAVEHPLRTRGLVFLSAATHPWPGGATSWYNTLARQPVVGWLFTQALTLPAGTLQLGAATKCVFAPNRLPDDYGAAAISLVLRPSAFRANAIDVAGLFDHVVKASTLYSTIDAPTVVITGDRDTVVYEEIHSEGLARDIPGAELVWVHNLGHKPDWVVPELVLGAVEKVAGKTVDLDSIARSVEARISGDAFGSECTDPGLPGGEQPANP
ncbi:alpha/beta fold hydrolase [Mesorhizobium sp. NBSH29]|uniref:alpha/beta fold hydrolase n=1 Tax=Mesorhizobium sp. NBSH29 TaxID=2654249 RepID=UPI0018967634|nr:alpha/beta hydrolase [Mesorhizobium sp. NBSH29]QPC85824.1 alpha/beta fold hydrolase [Mesorhizobium sp. NBSH29]